MIKFSPAALKKIQICRAAGSLGFSIVTPVCKKAAYSFVLRSNGAQLRLPLAMAGENMTACGRLGGQGRVVIRDCGAGEAYIKFSLYAACIIAGQELKVLQISDAWPFFNIGLMSETCVKHARNKQEPKYARL
jgi:hypothetical protein